MNALATFSRIAVLLASAISVASCGVPPSQPELGAATHGLVRRSEFEVVDCLLPGEVRQLGNMSFLTQRRPARTTVSECWIRGGEYVAYDRADLNSALRIWMAAAQAGDAEAQTNLGEIYERGGNGIDADFESASMWYRQAADQGYSRALFNLGTLYEQGRGVPRDTLTALNLYREASGIPEDSLVYLSAARQEQERMRSELETYVAEKNSQIDVLQRQVKELERNSRLVAENRKKDAQTEVQAIRNLIAQLESERSRRDAQLSSLSRPRASQRRADVASVQPAALESAAEGINFGRYYAIVIGNQNYRSLEELKTARNDVRRISRILSTKYGFNVTLVEDANDTDILRALTHLNAVLGPDDNLLIYYAGHGKRVTTHKGEQSYWLPVNTGPASHEPTWLPNEQITMHLARLRAQRVLVVADSCYGGLLVNDPSYFFLDEYRRHSKEYLTYKAQKRSRLLLSSGSDQPVPDNGGGANSVFARAFADELEANDRVLSTPELFLRIRDKVEAAAATNKLVQSPEFKSIKGAGHEVGDFFFIPVEQQLTKTSSQQLGIVASLQADEARL